MKNTITQLPEIIDIKPRSINILMYDDSMEHYIDSESARSSIPYLSKVIAHQVHFNDITDNEDYVIELLSGDISICKLESMDRSLKMFKLNPEYPSSSIAINQVKLIYEIYQVQKDRNNL